MEKYPSETRIVLALKKGNPMRLDDLSAEIGISKMGILNHIQKLESKGMVERLLVKSKVGRPYYVFKLKEESKESVARADQWVLDGLIDYLEKTGNGNLAEEFLKERYVKVKEEYQEKLAGLSHEKKVEALTRLREEENYYPELKETGNGSYELLEYNCPIYRVAGKISLACSLESRMFSSVLDAEVNSTHRQVNGSDVCRFLIKKKEPRY